MSQGTLFIISAPSGAGKSSLINALLNRFNVDNKIKLSVSHTTRQMRPGEENHKSYHFVSVDEFLELISKNSFYEYAKVFDNYYGTSREIVEQWLGEGYDVLLDIDWQGARLIREQTKNTYSIFILPPSLEELERRLINRGQDSEEVIKNRMDKAKREISHYNEYDYLLINDDFDETLSQLHAIIKAHRVKRENQESNHEDLIKQLLS